MNTPLVTIENLHRSFGATIAVAGLNFQVEAGQIVGLVGPDGAGKTTTLRILCGALQADSGSVHVAGIDVARQPDMVRRMIGYVAQRFSLYGDLTVLENMRFFADVYQLPKSERSAMETRLLEFSQLGPFRNRRAEALSGGMKQKLALACALIHHPQLLILDEPTTGVDPVARREFWDILGHVVHSDGVTVLIATPYMDEADRCHSVGFMRAGQLLASGSPRELQRHVADVVLELRATPVRQAEQVLHSMPAISDVQILGDRLHVFMASAPDEQAFRQQLQAQGVNLVSMRTVAPTMEDVFLTLARAGREHSDRVAG